MYYGTNFIVRHARRRGGGGGVKEEEEFYHLWGDGHDAFSDDG